MDFYESKNRLNRLNHSASFDTFGVSYISSENRVVFNFLCENGGHDEDKVATIYCIDSPFYSGYFWKESMGDLELSLVSGPGADFQSRIDKDVNRFIVKSTDSNELLSICFCWGIEIKANFHY